MARQYKCPGCGKKVKFGAHFCSGIVEPQLDDPFPEYHDRPWFTALKRIGILAVAVYLILLLLRVVIPLLLYIGAVLGIMAISFPVILLTRKLDGDKGERLPDYNALVRLLHGDRESAERLITAENQKYPEFTRKDCIRRVHDKLVYDRSR